MTKPLVVETEAKTETAGFETEAKAEAVASETEAQYIVAYILLQINTLLCYTVVSVLVLGIGIARDQYYWMMMMMMMMMDELQSCHKVQETARTRNSKMCHAVMSEQWKRL